MGKIYIQNTKFTYKKKNKKYHTVWTIINLNRKFADKEKSDTRSTYIDDAHFPSLLQTFQ
jgi:hypothetical protein